MSSARESDYLTQAVEDYDELDKTIGVADGPDQLTQVSAALIVVAGAMHEVAHELARLRLQGER